MLHRTNKRQSEGWPVQGRAGQGGGSGLTWPDLGCKRVHMPTKKKRFSLAISHDLHSILFAWGKLQNVPASSVVAAFLEQNKPTFRAIVAALEAAKHGKEKEAMKAMAVLTGSALSQLGEVMQGKKKV